MRVAVAGAGAVGCAVARALTDAGHAVLLIERDRSAYLPDLVPEADWMLADACEPATFEAAGIDGCDVVMAATGDDRVNLVFSMLAKTEFAVSRVVARVNRPDNQWLYNGDWGVDVAVSTPGSLAAAVGEAVSVGDVIELMTLHRGGGRLAGITVPVGAAVIGTDVREVCRLGGVTPAGVVRSGTLLAPNTSGSLQAGDEIVLLAAESAMVGESGEHLRRLIAGGSRPDVG